MTASSGKVVQVLGNVVDVEFSADTMPKINDSLTVRVNDDAGAPRNGAVSDGTELGRFGDGRARPNVRSAKDEPR